MKKTFGLPSAPVRSFFGVFELVRTQLGFTDLMSTGIWILSACVVSVVALVRTPLFTQTGMATFAPPGEEFALRPVRSNFLAHLALIIPWCFLGVFQFVPSVRKFLSFTYHRVAGRVFLLLSLGVAASGLSMASRAFGGSFVSQVGMAVLFFSFLLSIAFGYLAVRSKDIPSHRDWMIRLFSYGTSVRSRQQDQKAINSFGSKPKYGPQDSNRDRQHADRKDGKRDRSRSKDRQDQDHDRSRSRDRHERGRSRLES